MRKIKIILNLKIYCEIVKKIKEARVNLKPPKDIAKDQ